MTHFTGALTGAAFCRTHSAPVTRALASVICSIICTYKVDCDGCAGRPPALTPCTEQQPPSPDATVPSAEDAGADGGSLAVDLGPDSGTLVTVEPVYALAPDWNDYVRVADAFAEPWKQPGLLCDGTETGGRNLCVHAGDKRRVSLVSPSACAGLSATDDLGAFTWVCREEASGVTFYGQLAPDKRLADLVTSAGWRANFVTVTSAAQGAVAHSVPGTWWSNPVMGLPAGAATAVQRLDTARAIYVADVSTAVAGINLNADKQALVVARGATLSSAVTASTCRASTGEATNPSLRAMVCSGGQKFLWLEGDFDGVDGTASAIQLVSTSFARIASVRIKNADRALYADRSRNLRIGPALLTANLSELTLLSSNYNTVWQVHGFGDLEGPETGGTVQLDGASDNAIGDLLGVANGVPPDSNGLADGIWFFNTSTDNTLTRCTFANNLNNGVGFDTAANDRNTLVSVLVASNYDGVWFNQGGTSDNTTFSDLASVDARISGGGSGIRMANGTSNNKLTGRFVVGNNNTDCNIVGGTLPGLTGSCQPDGASDFTLRAGQSSATSFVGAVTTDRVNASHASGRAAFAKSMDLWGFENDLRSWGLGTANYPDPTSLGACSAGDTCQLWDWSLRSSDTVLRAVNGTFQDGQPCPPSASGNNTTTNRGSPAQTFLRAAVEVLGDEQGDEDGLCESNEVCLFLPNVGAYQGHGPLGACTFTDGAVSGVKLLGYTLNGR